MFKYLLICILGMQSLLLASQGSLDKSFGGDGIVTSNVGKYDEANAIAIQKDSKIVVVGHSVIEDEGEEEFDGIENKIDVIRYNTDGTLDTSFDGNGIVTTSIGNNILIPTDIAIQNDGKIVITGTMYISSDSGTDSDESIFVMRYNSDGTLDTSFDDDGIVITTIESDAQSYALAIQNDGKIVITGDPIIVRYNTDGTIDTGFGNEGIIVTAAGYVLASIAIQSDGKIVLAGVHSPDSGNGNILVMRCNPDGTLDTSFDDDGVAITEIDNDAESYAVAIQNDGKIVVTGETWTGNNFDSNIIVIRYNPDGSEDISFGDDGIVITSIDSQAGAYDIAIQNDNNIVVTGTSTVQGNSRDYALTVVRYNISGTLDTNFDGDGIVTTKIYGDGDSYDVADGIAIQSDGKIVVAGKTESGGWSDIAVVRYEATSTMSMVPIYYLLQ